MERSGNFYKAIQLGYILISILIGCMAYNSLYEWQEIEALELGNKKIDELRKEINNINIQMIKFSLLGETILEWNDKDIEHYHSRRMAMDSMLCRFKATYPAERIDSLRSLLEDKERQMFQIVRLMDEQQSINKKIANQIPVIAQKSVQEQSKKPKRKGFLGIFGKKEGTKPTTTTTTLRSVNRNVISEQKVQDRQLSEQADSLAARNAELNRQLQELICQIEEKVQTELQSRENEIVAMREKSFMQVGGLMGFVLLLLLISYIIIHRDAKSIKQYKHKTTDLIRQLEQSVQRNEALITSRKKAVHTITHELRTPLTAITGYAGLIRKEQCEDKSGQYIQNILQSSDRMRDMLNTLLDFFRLDNGKEQPGLIILDLGLPDIDGLDVLKILREWYQKPIIILSVRNSEEDIVKALDNGANDYLAKPFRTGELLARIRAAFRQNQGISETPVLEFGTLVIDLANHTARKNNEIIKLTSTEFSLLVLLAKNEGRVLTHQYILKEVWGMA